MNFSTFIFKNAIAKVFIFCLSIGSLMAQSEGSDQGFRFGIFAAPNISYISAGDAEVETSAKLRFGFGLMAEFDFAPNYSFSTGINIVNKGAKMSQDSIDATYRAQFLQVPIMLKMSTREFGYFTYFAEFGGSLDIEINEEVSISPEKYESNLDSHISPFNAMFCIGGGAEYSLGGGTAFIAGIYYNRSLINNLNTNPPLVSSSKSYQFDYVNLKIGVLF